MCPSTSSRLTLPPVLWIPRPRISTPFFPTLHLIFSLSPSTESFTHSSYLHVGLAAQLTHSPRSPFNIIFLVLVELYCGYLAGSHPKTVLPCSQQMGKEWKMICDPGSNVSLATYWLRDGELVSGLTHFKGDANKNLLHWTGREMYLLHSLGTGYVHVA